jgi:uncharacterized protein YndB with AHSA1/START domain/DNA-binding transcriptional ArsR family regulator
MTSGESSVDLLIYALSDASRRHLLDRLNERDGQTQIELCFGLAMSRQSVSKHLAILERAQLVTSIRRGRRRLHYLNAVPICELSNRWITAFDRQRANVLLDLKKILEDPTMNKPEFVYTLYIDTTPEQLWRALTEPQFTKVWWETTFATDWSVGAKMIWDNHGIVVDDPEQIVLAYEPYRRLAYTWHTFTDELGERFKFTQLAQMTSESRSRVAFDLEATDLGVKLTVTHDNFDPGSVVVGMISGGWPALLSKLKTMIERDELAL